MISIERKADGYLWKVIHLGSQEGQSNGYVQMTLACKDVEFMGEIWTLASVWASVTRRY